MLRETPERIFIDATYTIGSGKNSGIERVVRNLLRESQTLGLQGKIPAPTLIVSHAGKFFATSDADLAAFQKTAKMQADVLATAPAWYKKIAGLVCKLVPSPKLTKWLLPQPGHLGAFKLLHNFLESRVLRGLSKRAQAVQARPGDLFLLPDAYWIKRLRGTVWPAAAEVRRNGARVASVIYDLIPLTHPQFVGAKGSIAFLDYLKKAANHSDLLLAISETVRQQVEDFLREIETPSDQFCTKICAFQLGAELSTAVGEVRGLLREVFSGPNHPYLMVSTFDPRKNHKYLLDAFDLLWQSRPDLKLCLVGRIGSRCDDTITRIVNHPRIGKQLYLFDNLTDAELQYCYHRTRGVVFPSIVEGFGLPIVESLWFGKKTFVSDTAIHREVGQTDCCYFSLESPGSLVEAIEDWEKALLEEPPPAIPERRPTTWSETCRQVLQHCSGGYDQLHPTSAPAKTAA